MSALGRHRWGGHETAVCPRQSSNQGLQRLESRVGHGRLGRSSYRHREGVYPDSSASAATKTVRFKTWTTRTTSKRKVASSFYACAPGSRKLLQVGSEMREGVTVTKGVSVTVVQNLNVVPAM